MPFKFNENLKQSLEKIFPKRVGEPSNKKGEEHYIQIYTVPNLENIHYELHNRNDIQKIGNKNVIKKVGRYELHFEGVQCKEKNSKEYKIIEKLKELVGDHIDYGILRDFANHYQFAFWLKKNIYSLEDPSSIKDLTDFIEFFDNIFLDLSVRN